MATEAQRRAAAKYDKANTISQMMKLNLKTEQDIIRHLAKQPNRQGYIKALIRADMAKQGKE